MTSQQKPRFELVDGHLRRALAETQPYARFECAWKAFNVLFEAEHTDDGSGNREVDLIRRAVARLGSVTVELFARAPVAQFVDLEPVFDEKNWSRSGVEDHSKHNIVRKRLRTDGPRTVDDLQALVEALYVVRCNLAHGFKTPDGARDREVLEAAAPVMLEIAAALRSVRDQR